MSVFRQIQVEWDGVTYTITPTLSLLRRIENEVVIADVVSGIGQMQPKISHIAFLLSAFMRTDVENGENAPSEEDVFHALMNDRAGELLPEATTFLMLAIGIDPPKRDENDDENEEQGEDPSTPEPDE